MPSSRWRKAELGDHVELTTGFPFKSVQFTEDPKDIWLLRGDNVGQGFLRWDGAKRWPRDDVEQFAEFQVRKGDVILAMDRPWIAAGLKYGWVTERDVPALLVQRVARLRGHNGLHTDFLRYLIGSKEFTDHVLSITTGVNVPHISARDIKAFRFDLPPIAIQHRIASILVAYDDLIENNTRRIAMLEEMARRFYSYIFEYSHDQREWRNAQVSDICTLTRGRSYRGVDLVEEGGRPFVNLKCMDRGGGFRRNGLKRYAGVFKEDQTVTAGDIVMAMTDMTQERRLVAHVARVPTLKAERAVISMDMVKLAPTKGVTATYLYAFFRWSGFSDKVKHHATGTNVLHLNPNAILEHKLRIPPGDLIGRYTSFAKPIFELIDSLDLQRHHLTAARDLLLPKLISGEIDLSKAEATREPEAA